MSRPIEEGCLAIVVDGACPNDPDTNIGKLVRVGKFLGKTRKIINDVCHVSVEDDLWKVDKPMTCFDQHGEVTFEYAQSERKMQRIDDTDTETTTATTDVPDEITA